MTLKALMDELSQPYVRMKMDILATAQPIYTGRWGLNELPEVSYAPEVQAQLDTVDKLQQEHQQGWINWYYDVICYGMGAPGLAGVVRRPAGYATWGIPDWTEHLWRPEDTVRQMAKYNARSAT